MRFIYDFELWVWNNLRISIRRLGPNSIWYKTLKALLGIFDVYTEKANWLYSQIWLESSSGLGLSLWGKRYGIRRWNNETDDNFRARTQQYKLLTGSGITRKAKRFYVADILETDPTNITITNVYGSGSMAMGSKLGIKVQSRKMVYYGYEIRIPFEITDEAKKQRMIDLINTTNFGGNYPVFVENIGEYPVMSMGSVMGSVVRSKYRDLDNTIYKIY